MFLLNFVFVGTGFFSMQKMKYAWFPLTFPSSLTNHYPFQGFFWAECIQAKKC